MPTTPPAVAIVTCSRYAVQATEDRQLIDALGRLGIKAVHAAWDDPQRDWTPWKLAVVRSTWDYPQRLGDFLAWARRPRRVMNSLDVLQWNTDKRYLTDLAAAGLPIIPTRFVGPEDDFQLPQPPFVVKPAVSNGAQETAWYRAGDNATARRHVRRLQAAGRVVMLQTYLPSVETQGEANLVFIGGSYSHSIRRSASLQRPGLTPDGAVPPASVQSYEPTPAERTLAERVMACVPGNSSGLLFGRIDLVAGPDGMPMILEAELTEPALFLDYVQDGAERLAAAVAAALGAH